jgi:2-deoxy-D-gluconate 3-dehydrogenase
LALTDLFSVRGKVALITGGSRGIGRMIAQAFVEDGATVYISSRKAEACEATAAELSAGGGRCVALPQDVSTVPGCRALAEAFAAREDKLDVLVNNAGAAWGAELDGFPEAGWDKVVDLNMKSPFFLTQALLPALRAAASAERPAKVIMVASIDGQRPNPMETYSYQASKAGLIHLTRRLAARLVGEHVCVNAIAPGAFASEMNRDARDHGDEVARRIPARRIGRDEDMQAAALYLASRAGDYVVGATLTVDGGIVWAQAGV